MVARTQLKKNNILLYATSDTDADILYATGFLAPDPFIYIKTVAGKSIMVMSDLELDRARATTKVNRVLSVSQYANVARERIGRAPHVADIIAAVLRDLKIRSVSVPENFPLGLAKRLRQRRVGIRVVTGPFFSQRIRKRPHELKEIRRAMRAAEAGMQAAVDTLRRSRVSGGWVMLGGKRLTAQALRHQVNSAVFAHGALPAYTIVAPGKQGCDPHESGSGPIRAHQPIIVDIFPRLEESGYFGDITRTFVKGRASARVQEMFDAVLAAQRLGVRSIRPRANGKTIHEAIHELFAKRGFETGRIDGRMQGFFHGTGHGLGLEVHEPPRIGAAPDVLESGMVVTVEPGLYYWPIGGVRIEDTVVVTPRGVRNLTRFPKFLEIR